MRQGDSVRAGDLNLLIALYSRADTGDPATSGETLIAAGIPASKESMPGAARERDEAGREVAAEFSVFTIRYRPGVDTASTLTFAGVRWDIDNVDNVNGSNRLLAITARKVR